MFISQAEAPDHLTPPFDSVLLVSLALFAVKPFDFDPMKIDIVTPAPPRSRKGNRITALRWSRVLRDLGHRVRILETWEKGKPDILVALHAKRSHESVVRFRDSHPDRPLILALTGTDVYDDIHVDASAKQSLELADRFITLQPGAAKELPVRLRSKARVVYQSFT